MNRRMLLRVSVVAILAVSGLSLGWIVIHRTGPVGTAVDRDARPVQYHCPMHPTIVADRPGDCPICGMRLVPLEPEGRGPATQPAPEPPRKIVYRSTMNPNETSDHPGQDSMGMEMVPVEIEQPAGAAVDDRAAVRISLQKQQLIGVKTSPVTRAPFRRTLRAVSQVTLDETRLHHLHTKVSGYVERLFANATGESVLDGAPLLEIYSPELLASQQEYLVALEARRRTAGSSLESVAASGEQLVVSARRRLELFDIAEEQILELEQTGQARRTVTVFAPMAGTVILRNVTHGERVGPEMTLLDLADLSRVWAIASVYEYELPFVHDGQRATLTLSYVPGKTFEGRVSFVYPTLDPQTRTAQVRIELANPTFALKPGMYGEALIEADLGPRLAVPATAVIETGTRSLVFVDLGEGLFEPREIRLGLRLPELYEVLSGLEDGERVLTSGNFLVDSESRLGAALAAATQPAAHEH